MSKFNWKGAAAAAVFAGAGIFAASTGAGALTVSVPTPMVASQHDGQVVQVAKRSWRYNRSRHGHRYSHRRHGYNHYHHGYWYSRPWWSLSIPLVVPQVGFYGGGSAHVQYCSNRYRSYNPATDMFLGYDGNYHRCIGPY